MALQFTTSFLEDSLTLFRYYKKLAEGAMAQVSDQELTAVLDGEMNSVMQAINRQLAHYPYHCGQIVMLAKHFRSEQWKSLTVPKNKSADFNRAVSSGEKSQR